MYVTCMYSDVLTKKHIGLVQPKPENNKDTEYTETTPTIAFDLFHKDSKHMVMICPLKSIQHKFH